MKKMMKYFFAGMFFTFLLSNTFAQTVSTSSSATTVEQKTANALTEIANAVTLTSDQIEKITPFLNEFYKQKDIDQAQYKDNEESLKTAAKERKETLLANLKTVLSEDQIGKIKEYLKKQNNQDNEDFKAVKDK
jgi:hypothetical protein